MAEIMIDTDKATRVIAQILCDEKKLLPQHANDLAVQICLRLSTAKVTPAGPHLSHYRMIPPWLPTDSDFEQRLAEMGLDKRFSRDVWTLVYACSRDLPASITDTAPALHFDSEP